MTHWRARMHANLAYLGGLLAMAAGVALDILRGRRRRATITAPSRARHAYGTAIGTEAQRQASADTIRFRPPALYQTGRPLYPGDPS